MQTVLTIAGFDPSSGAGITADLMVFAAHGLFGTSCITALTVQSTRGVFATYATSSELMRDTLERLAEDLPPAGVKIGMLANEQVVTTVVAFLTKIRKGNTRIPIVLDPVMRSSSGRELITPAGIDILRTQLLPLVDWITPNLDELAVISGMACKTKSQVELAAQTVQKQQDIEFSSSLTLNVLVTGGHQNPPDDLFLMPKSKPIWLAGSHIVSSSTHGTGCAFSSALLSRLVLGDTPYAAALEAKNYVAQAIRSAVPRGGGRGPLQLLGPVTPVPRTQSPPIRKADHAPRPVRR